MKKAKKIFIIAFLLLIYIYIVAIENIPKSTILIENEELNIKTIFGITLEPQKEETVVTSSNVADETNEVGVTNVDVKLFNSITVKTVTINVIPETTVVPVGTVSGVKLYTNGVLVVGMSEIKGIDNIKYKPYENSGIEEGDMILNINDKKITNTKDVLEVVNNSNGENLKITYSSEGETKECSITPIQTSKKEYKIGLWIRDSAAGIGTMTYYEKSTGNFAALGHGITDVDTGGLINISNGEFLTTNIISIIKGVKGSPGKIQGTLTDGKNIGKIYKNSEFGIYGKVDNIDAINLDTSKEIKVALRNEISLGKATILCDLDNNGAKEYEIEIEKIFINNNYDNKSMLIKVTDAELLNKTGGIIQGMSGCPIIQNGKFIGAITNVLVNDPTQGYAVFGDLMIKESKSCS